MLFGRGSNFLKRMDVKNFDKVEKKNHENKADDTGPPQKDNLNQMLFGRGNNFLKRMDVKNFDKEEKKNQESKADDLRRMGVKNFDKEEKKKPESKVNDRSPPKLDLNKLSITLKKMNVGNP